MLLRAADRAKLADELHGLLGSNVGWLFKRLARRPKLEIGVLRVRRVQIYAAAAAACI